MCTQTTGLKTAKFPPSLLSLADQGGKKCDSEVNGWPFAFDLAAVLSSACASMDSANNLAALAAAGRCAGPFLFSVHVSVHDPASTWEGVK
eukprot:439433-Pelagomonas_calceolata.AAC.1